MTVTERTVVANRLARMRRLLLARRRTVDEWMTQSLLFAGEADAAKRVGNGLRDRLMTRFAESCDHRAKTLARKAMQMLARVRRLEAEQFANMVIDDSKERVNG